MPKLKKTREEICNKAEELGIEYEKKYGGCAQSTFYATADALRWGGLEILPKNLQDRMYPGVCLLSAGGCFTGEGTCGAVTGSMITSGFAFGLNIDAGDPAAEGSAGKTVRDTLMANFYKEFGSILCKDVMRKYFGKAWDLNNDEMTAEFLSVTDGCVIRKTARWMADILLDKYEKGELKAKAGKR
jgi:hypothetical protein